VNEKEKQVNVRLPSDLADWLKGHARDCHRSVTSQLIFMLERERVRTAGTNSKNAQ